MKEPTLAGKLLYKLYYNPRRKIYNVLQKGIGISLLESREEAKMKKCALALNCSLIPEHDTTLHFLSGADFWHQTLFCAYSFLHYSQYAAKICIWDDGSLTDTQKSTLRAFYSGVEIREEEEIEARLNKHLPFEKYPYLRQRRKLYPHLRKLTDIHCSESGWQLVLDSDMLFHRKPEALLAWMKNPEFPCYMIDSETSYGYDHEFLESCIEKPLLKKVNVGITGLCSDHIDWDLLEHWCRKMIEERGTQYTQEQALIALYLSTSDNSYALPAKEYLVLPDEKETRAPKATLHHYVAESKSWYFRYGWQHII